MKPKGQKNWKRIKMRMVVRMDVRRLGRIKTTKTLEDPE